MDKFVTLTFWLNQLCPAGHGYTPKTDEKTATLRIGPVVIGWELVDGDAE